VARTGEASWAEANLKDLFSGREVKFNEDLDIKGPVTIMAYASITIPSDEEMIEEIEESAEVEKKEKEAIVLVVGDSDFVSNTMYKTQGNKDLFLNTINYLADRGELISIRPKQQESVYLTMTLKQGRIAFFVSIIIIPLFIIILGLYINIQRRVKS